jgi:hypothetical protein
VLLSGVTIITHGFQGSPLDFSQPNWVSYMAAEIGANATPDTSYYYMKVNLESPLPYSPLKVTEFTPVEPVVTTPSQSSKAEIVVMLDWSAVANSILFPDVTTQRVASVVAPVLEQFGAADGLVRPLAELPIHLIGHSRGASLVGALAEDLGAAGLWIDQVTFLDSHPLLVPSDWGEVGGMFVTSNVVFADSYWRSGSGSVDGEKVPGAYDIELDNDVMKGEGYGSEHSDVHLWYHGTVDTVGSIWDGDNSVTPQPFDPDDFGWYSDNGESQQTSRDKIGYYYSRVIGGQRLNANAGVGEPFDGSGARRPIYDRSGLQWSNIGDIRLTDAGNSFTIGNSIRVSYRYQDYDSDATIRWYLDKDQNPYTTSNQVQLTSLTTPGATNTLVKAGKANLPTSGVTQTATQDTYYLLAAIDDGLHTRYAYLPGSITLQKSDPGNHPPVLGSPAVTPLTGQGNTSFEFTVRYDDQDGDPPLADNRTVNLSGGQVGVMTLKSGTAPHGVYSYTTTLPPGGYQHFFSFTDTAGYNALLGWRAGPQVSVNPGTDLSLRAREWSDPVPDGDDDSVPEAGEGVGLDINLENLGGGTLTDVVGTLSTSSSLVRITDSHDNYGTISASQSRWGNNDYL